MQILMMDCNGMLIATVHAKSSNRSEIKKNLLLHLTMQITAEKRGLNYYTLKDNFYSIKIKLETLVIRAKIRLKAQF